MNELESKEYYKSLLKRVSEKKEMTLNDYAEMWYYENNGTIPDRSSELWKAMYRAFIMLGLIPFDK